MRLELMGFCQAGLTKLGMSIEDALLLRWFVDYQGTRKMQPVQNTEDGRTYYWVNCKKVISDLPILTESERMVARRFNKLVEIGVLLKYSTNTGKGKISCYTINDDVYFYLTDLDDSDLPDINAKQGAMSPNSDMAMSPNSDMPYSTNITKISKSRDNLLDNKNSSELLLEAPNCSAVVVEIPLNDGSKFPVTEEMVKEYSETYPNVDVVQQFKSMVQWSLDNPKKKKTIKGVKRFINCWLCNHQDNDNRGVSTSSKTRKPVNNSDFGKGGEEVW